MSKIRVSICNGKVRIYLDKSLYEKEAVMAATYKMTASCFVQVVEEEDSIIQVIFSPKCPDAQDPLILDLTAGAFCNEVLDHQVRLDTEKRFGYIRDLLVEQAFSPIKNIEDRIKSP